MAISQVTRDRLRLILRSVEKADEIIDALDGLTLQHVFIDNMVNSTITAPSGKALLLAQGVVFQSGGHIIVQPGGELKLV